MRSHHGAEGHFALITSPTNDGRPTRRHRFLHRRAAMTYRYCMGTMPIEPARKVSLLMRDAASCITKNKVSAATECLRARPRHKFTMDDKKQDAMKKPSKEAPTHERMPVFFNRMQRSSQTTTRSAPILIRRLRV